MKHNDRIYRELRCQNCRKLICYEYIYAGRILFICPRCNEENVFTFKHYKSDSEIKEFEFEEGNKLKKSKGGEK